MRNSEQILMSGIDAGDFVAAVAQAVVTELRPLLTSTPAIEKRIATRVEMARILEWSEAKLDRRTAAGAIPSIMDEGRRMYEIERVLQTLREGTPAAEAKAAERQAAKQAAKAQKKELQVIDHKQPQGFSDQDCTTTIADAVKKCNLAIRRAELLWQALAECETAEEQRSVRDVMRNATWRREASP